MRSVEVPARRGLAKQQEESFIFHSASLALGSTSHAIFSCIRHLASASFACLCFASQNACKSPRREKQMLTSFALVFRLHSVVSRMPAPSVLYCLLRRLHARHFAVENKYSLRSCLFSTLLSILQRVKVVKCFF